MLAEINEMPMQHSYHLTNSGVIGDYGDVIAMTMTKKKAGAQQKKKRKKAIQTKSAVKKRKQLSAKNADIFKCI